MPIDFHKYHALGNDYIVIDPNRTKIDLTPRRSSSSATAISASARTASSGAPAATGMFGLRIFNPDGSEAEKSGNGLRIFSRYLVGRRIRQGQGRFHLETPGGRVAGRDPGRSGRPDPGRDGPRQLRQRR